MTVFILLAIPCLVLAGGAGTTGGITLSQTIGARAEAMAEAYTAVSGDVLGIYYNPALASTLKEKQAAILYQKGIAEDNFGAFSVGAPLGFGTVAGSLVYYNAGDVELIDLAGKERTVNAQKDLLAIFSYAKKIGKFSAGASLKYLSSKLAEEKATTPAFDLGGNYQINTRTMVGLAILNIGGELRYLKEADEIPLTIRAGISHQWPELLIAGDIVKRDDKTSGHIGAEYTFKKLLSIRAGYTIDEDLGGPGFGFGLNHNQFSINYALSSKEDLDLSHYVGLTYKLGSP